MSCLRWLRIVLTGVMLLAGPLAPAAWADHPQPPMASTEKSDTGYRVGAAVVNVFRVPGKAFFCSIGAVVGFMTLVVTLGSGHRAAAGVVEEGCGGPWVITAEDLKGAPEEEEFGKVREMY